MKMQTFARLATASILSLSLGLAGCGCSSSASTTSNDAQTTEESTPATEEPTQESTTTEAGDVVSVTLTNDTGYDIASIALRASGTDEYDAVHTFDSIEIKNGVSASVSFQEILVEGEPAQQYDILLHTTEDSYIEFYNIDLLSVQDLTLKYQNGVGYVEFRSAEGEEVQSTQEEAEQSIVENTSDIQTYDQQNQLG